MATKRSYQPPEVADKIVELARLTFIDCHRREFKGLAVHGRSDLFASCEIQPDYKTELDPETGEKKTNHFVRVLFKSPNGKTTDSWQGGQEGIRDGTLADMVLGLQFKDPDQAPPRRLVQRTTPHGRRSGFGDV